MKKAKKKGEFSLHTGSDPQNMVLFIQKDIFLVEMAPICYNLSQKGTKKTLWHELVVPQGSSYGNKLNGASTPFTGNLEKNRAPLIFSLVYIQWCQFFQISRLILLSKINLDWKSVWKNIDEKNSFAQLIYFLPI